MEQTQKAKDERAVLDELTKDLEATAEQVHNSLIQFATIKTEIKFLLEQVKDLRSGDGSGPIVTRIALLEQAIVEIKKYISRDTQSGTDILTRVAVLEEKIHETSKVTSQIISKKSPLDMSDKNGKWKFWGIVATGGFTFLTSVLSMLMHLLGN